MKIGFARGDAKPASTGNDRTVTGANVLPALGLVSGCLLGPCCDNSGSVFGGSAVALSPHAGPSRASLSPTNPLFGSWMGSQALRSALTTVDARPVVLSPRVDASYTRGSSRSCRRSAPSLPVTTFAPSAGSRVLKDQYQYGTCWAFATMGSLESWLMPAQNLDFSEDNLARNDGFDDPEGKGYNRGGNYLMSTAYLARWGGPVYESEDEYGDGYTPPGLTAASMSRTSTGSRSATRHRQCRHQERCDAVRGRRRVHVLAESSAYYNATNHSYYYGDSDPNTRENHGVLIVGWDDNYAASKFATTAPGNGAFIVKNSWGGTWACPATSICPTTTRCSACSRCPPSSTMLSLPQTTRRPINTTRSAWSARGGMEWTEIPIGGQRLYCHVVGTAEGRRLLYARAETPRTRCGPVRTWPR